MREYYDKRFFAEAHRQYQARWSLRARSYPRISAEAASANLIIDMPDDLARSLEGIAAAEHVTVEQLAVERLRSLVETSVEVPAGSAAAVLRAMRQSPHPSASDVAELEEAIATGRMPTQTSDLFSD